MAESARKKAQRIRQDAWIAEIVRSGEKEAAVNRRLKISRQSITLWKRDPVFCAKLESAKAAAEDARKIVWEEELPQLRSLGLEALKRLLRANDTEMVKFALEATDKELFDRGVRKEIAGKTGGGAAGPPKVIEVESDAAPNRSRRKLDEYISRQAGEVAPLAVGSKA